MESIMPRCEDGNHQLGWFEKGTGPIHGGSSMAASMEASSGLL